MDAAYDPLVARTLLRLGLWLTLIAFAMYLAHDAFPGSPIAQLVPNDVLGWILIAGVALVGGGIVIWILELIAGKALRRSFCLTCHRKVPFGDLYCREHLRAAVDAADAEQRRQRR